MHSSDLNRGGPVRSETAVTAVAGLPEAAPANHVIGCGTEIYSRGCTGLFYCCGLVSRGVA